jgi:hypothetical protein
VGRIGKLLSFIRSFRNDSNISDVKIDPGGGINITSEHFSSPGDDSHPLTSDYVITIKIPRTGGEVVVGYVDPINTPVAQEGDKRIYGRDGNGDDIVQVWLKNDGEALISNTNGSVKLRPDGGTVITTPLSTHDVAANGSIKSDNSIGSFELLADGSIKGLNTLGSFELNEASGNFIVNGVIIDVLGNINTTGIISGGSAVLATSLTVSGQEMKDHRHSQANDSNGNTESDTGVPI